jgi:hypothetical protein
MPDARSSSDSRIKPVHVPLLAVTAILAAAALLAFAHHLSGPFHFDDQEAIVQNAHIRELSDVGAVLTAPPQSAVAGRPVVSVSLAINHALGDLDPAGYRLWNLGVHAMNALLLFLVLKHALAHTPALSGHAQAVALASALVWLVHPLHSEVIGYVVQRSESMMASFFLVTLLASTRLIDGERSRHAWTAAAVAASALGMATKESMITAPVMVLLYDAVFGAGSIRVAWQRRRTLYLVSRARSSSSSRSTHRARAGAAPDSRAASRRSRTCSIRR